MILIQTALVECWSVESLRCGSLFSGSFLGRSPSMVIGDSQSYLGV